MGDVAGKKPTTDTTTTTTTAADATPAAVASDLAAALTEDLLTGPPHRAALAVERVLRLADDAGRRRLAVEALRSWARSRAMAEAAGLPAALADLAAEFLAVARALAAGHLDEGHAAAVNRWRSGPLAAVDAEQRAADRRLLAAGLAALVRVGEEHHQSNPPGSREALRHVLDLAAVASPEVADVLSDLVRGWQVYTVAQNGAPLDSAIWAAEKAIVAARDIQTKGGMLAAELAGVFEDWASSEVAGTALLARAFGAGTLDVATFFATRDEDVPVIVATTWERLAEGLEELAASIAEGEAATAAREEKQRAAAERAVKAAEKAALESLGDSDAAASEEDGAASAEELEAGEFRRRARHAALCLTDVLGSTDAAALAGWLGSHPRTVDQGEDAQRRRAALVGSLMLYAARAKDDGLAPPEACGAGGGAFLVLTCFLDQAREMRDELALSVDDMIARLLARHRISGRLVGPGYQLAVRPNERAQS